MSKKGGWWTLSSCLVKVGWQTVNRERRWEVCCLGERSPFKPIDQDSDANVIKWLLFCVSGVWERKQSQATFYIPTSCALKEEVSCSPRSAGHICRYFPLEFNQAFHLKCKSQPCSPDKRTTDTAAADIVLYNGMALSLREVQKIKFTIACRRAWREAKKRGLKDRCWTSCTAHADTWRSLKASCD